MQQLDYGNGNIIKNTLASAVPMLIAQMINLLYSMIDRIYIGRIPIVGTDALGGVGLTFPIIIIVTAFTNLFSGGGTPLFAIARGEGHEKRAKQILRLCLYLELITAFVLIITGEALAEPILRLFGATNTALDYSLPYMKIYLIGTVFSMLAIGLNPFINAQGLPTMGMASVVCGAVLNIVLDPLFIFSLNLGVSGAAIATVISQAVSACVVIYTLSKKTPIKIFNHNKNKSEKSGLDILKTGEGRLKIRYDLKLIWQIVSLGTASFVMQITNATVSIVCNAVLSRTGGHLYISVMTIISSLRQVFETPLLAICEGASPMVSYNLGASNYGRVRESVRVMTVVSFIYTIVIWILIMLFPAAFIAIFSSDKTILVDAMPATRIYFCGFLFMTLQYIGQTVYKALSKRGRSIFFSIFRKVILVVPLTYLLPMVWNPPVNGVFAAEPISNIIGGSASFFTMLFYIKSLGSRSANTN